MSHNGFGSRWVVGYILLTFVVTITLEFLTPPEYILGYFYVIPILLANWFLQRRATILVTGLGVLLTLANLVFPRWTLHSTTAIVDRCITVTALVTVAYLGSRYREAEQQAARQQAQLQAQEALTRVREDFIATLTHDLKTPLLGAQQTLTFFHQGQFGPVTPEQHQVLALLQKSSQQQLSMVETLLTIFRNETQGLDLKLSTVDLDELCAESVTFISPLALSREIELVYEGVDHALVEGDPLQLRRVLSNLLSNALKHTPRQGRVTVRLLHEPEHRRILVEDTGSGLSHQDLKRVFERFYQSQSTRSVPGTGLGLYLSRQIVEAHGGEIWAACRPERGCTFGVRLPLRQAGKLGTGLSRGENG
ncbi:sensor histidine kinase [Anthocerotibacter panamensis]|uniref:sensor histidine kinase n=1 Tax=Anthocerotibacter panamensis TaxID=2857077 RepID=UPI001C40410D|nr:HAMP domain-containing sensor histidine kinase [Anthocerotibacter panamensis]